MYGTAKKITTEPSYPNSDHAFSGTFIGDYNAITVDGLSAHPIWTDIRGPTFDQNAMVYTK